MFIVVRVAWIACQMCCCPQPNGPTPDPSPWKATGTTSTAPAAIAPGGAEAHVLLDHAMPPRLLTAWRSQRRVSSDDSATAR